MDFQNLIDELEGHYEWQDSDLLKVEIKESKLKGCGKGLFARQKINKKEMVSEYYGSIVDWESSESNHFDN